MLAGDTCTRACRFCAVKTTRQPPPLDPAEPEKIAKSVAELKLRYVVLTSVDRDDLADGGASHFASTIKAIRRVPKITPRIMPRIMVESLVPDFCGNASAVKTVVEARPDVYGHNIETVYRLQNRVRDPRAGYLQSLATLRMAKSLASSCGFDLLTKSSIMLGLGETEAEIEEIFDDLRSSGVDILTLGQYLRPSLKHLPVERYFSPEEFERLKTSAMTRGFLFVAAGPMVRSSYRAGEFLMLSQKKE